MWAAAVGWIGGAAAATTAAAVEAATGVRIEVVTRPQPLFGDADRRAEPVRTDAEVAAALDTLQRELLRYPPALRSRLGTVQLTGRITLGGRFAVGTSTCRGARVALGHERPTARGQELVAMALHHELGHLALCDPARRAAWLRLSTTTVATGRFTMWPTDDPSLLSRGFVTPYGATAPGEDFAEYASTLLVHPGALAAREAAHPEVAKKAAFVRGVYASLGVVPLPAAIEPPAVPPGLPAPAPASPAVPAAE